MVRDMPSIYQVPMLLEKQGLIPLLKNILALDSVTISDAHVKKGSKTWAQWRSLTGSEETRFYDTVSIALVGKYTELHDSYLSVIKSLEHSAMRCRRVLKISWIDSEHLEQKTLKDNDGLFYTAWSALSSAQGVLVPGGFGVRGTEGMIAAAKHAREKKKPYLGICLGMQIAVIEYARNVCGMENATSDEFRDGAKDELITFMPEIDKTTMGATMRLGLRPTLFQEGSEWSRLRALYAGKTEILERHRHRYEVNPKYIQQIEQGGLSFIGKDDAGVRMEVIEIKDHPWYVGVQFHPEYLSRVLDPSRPYLGFVAASAGVLSEITRDYQNGNGGMSAEGLTNGVEGLSLNGSGGAF